MREREIYELQCHSCGRTVTLPCGEAGRCPQCGAALDIEWDSPRLEAEAARLREYTAAVEAVTASMRVRLEQLETKERLERLPFPRWTM